MAAIRAAYGTHRATPEIWAECHAVYLGMISRLDDQFGRLVSKLELTGLDTKTVTMVFTDHGEYLGDYDLIEKWPSGLSDSLVHEPLLLGGGGLPSGVVVDEMAEMVDLVPSIFQLCGIGEHFGHNGTSWLATIYDGTPHKEYAFSEGGFLKSEEPLVEKAKWPYDLKAKLQHEDTSLVGKAIAMRSKEWTYIYRLYEPGELYDRVKDPKELHNLSANPEMQHVVRMLEGVLLRWLVEKGDVMPWTKDPRRSKIEMDDPKVQYERRMRARERQ
jgi:arylsulfatase A-like enzyme